MKGNHVLFILLLLSGACGTDSGDPLGDPAFSQAALRPEESLAQWVATAMRDRNFRSQVLREMRASPYSEHALPMAELIDRPGGQWFVRALSIAGGVTEADVRTTLSALPTLDFYMPSGAHRRSWAGGAEPVIVAIKIDPSSTIFGVGADGQAIPLDLATALPAMPLFMLQFSEHRAYRLRPQPSGPGDRIQDPNEEELAAALVRALPGGGRVLIQLRDIVTGPQAAEYCPPEIPGCPPEGGGGGSGDPGTPVGGPGSTYLTELQTLGECDNGNCFEGNEFEFHAHSVIGFDVLRIEGVPSTVRWTGLQLRIAPYSPSAQVTITMSAWETDGWPNPDDHYLWVYNDGSLHYGDPVLQVTPFGNNGALWPLQKDVHATSENIRARYGWLQ